MDLKHRPELEVVLLKYLAREIGMKEARKKIGKMDDEELEWEYVIRVMKPL